MNKQSTNSLAKSLRSLETEIVDRDISKLRENWGAYTELRHKIFEMPIGKTMKIGPFENHEDAKKARSALTIAGATKFFGEKHNVKFHGVTELIGEEWFLFIQKSAKE